VENLCKKPPQIFTQTDQLQLSDGIFLF